MKGATPRPELGANAPTVGSQQFDIRPTPRSTSGHGREIWEERRKVTDVTAWTGGTITGCAYIRSHNKNFRPGVEPRSR